MKILVPSRMGAGLFLVLAFVSTAMLLCAQAPDSPKSESKKIAIFADPSAIAADREGELLAEELRSEVESTAREAGYEIVEAPAPGTMDGKDSLDAPPAKAALALETAWLAVYSLQREGDRIDYRIEIYDARDGTLVGGDSFTALGAASALRLFHTSAEDVIKRLSDYQGRAKEAESRAIVGYQIVVKSAKEGAWVSLVLPGGNSLYLGSIRQGQLVLPYRPFLIGTQLSLAGRTLSGEELAASAVLGPEPLVLTLKSISTPRHFDSMVGLGSGGLPDLQTRLRGYFKKDWTFFYLEERAYADFSYLQGGDLNLHDEVDAGLGSYLFLPPESRFRLGAALGIGGLFSVDAYNASGNFDPALILSPIDFFAEYRLLNNLSLYLGGESKYAIVKSGSSQQQGWSHNGMPVFTLGLLWSWER